MPNENQNEILFSDEELEVKEKQLLELMKHVLLEFRRVNQKETKIPFHYKKSIQDSFRFHNYAVCIRLLNADSGLIVIWGKRISNDEYQPRVVKINFLLSTSGLYYKLDSFIKYSTSKCSLLKDICKRLDIKNEEDYNLLLKSFETLLVSYI